MKEVEVRRLAGPFDSIPYENYIQSPIGLVPKVGGKTRLIFHLSYRFSGDDEGMSLNEGTPQELCSVKYNDIDAAVDCCLRLSNNGENPVFLGKTDASHAFRVLPLHPRCFCWMILKAEDPMDGKIKYFIDKCLPFGASISCALYQKFSDSLRFIIEVMSNSKSITNYLDDILFAALRKWLCDQLIQHFMDLCEEINVPIAIEKTEWGTDCLIFLGILLHGARFILAIPIEKQRKALNLLNEITHKKVTIKLLQTLAGYLNFLNKAIVLGRTFTRRIYSKFSALQINKSGKLFKPHHHVTVDQELRFDCEIWKYFLSHHTSSAICRPMVDLVKQTFTAEHLNFYSDASTNVKFGIRAIFENKWLFAQWEDNFIKEKDPSIEYLELVGVVGAMLTRGHLIRNRRVIVNCDNISVVCMINSMTSSCKNCMYLLHLLTLNNMIFNRRTFARHVSGIHNELSDSLSRMDFK